MVFITQKKIAKNNSSQRKIIQNRVKVLITVKSTNLDNGKRFLKSVFTN